jgi:hypothetical protein
MYCTVSIPLTASAASRIVFGEMGAAIADPPNAIAPAIAKPMV